MGVPVELISHQVGQTASTGPGLSAVWVLGAVLFWGATLGWAYQQLLIVGGTVAKPVGLRGIPSSGLTGVASWFGLGAPRRSSP